MFDCITENGQPNDLCFTAAYTEWGENVNVIPCLSRESNDDYRHGHVQDVLEQDDDAGTIFVVVHGNLVWNARDGRVCADASLAKRYSGATYSHQLNLDS